MEIITRQQWGARSVSLSAMSVPQDDVFIHHTADSGPTGGSSATQIQEASYMRSVEAFHISSRGMRAVAYNFIVMPSGRVYEGRGWAKDGGHTACCNSSSHAVCFAGNFQSMKPTDAAIASAREVIVLGVSRGFVKAPRIRGHRDVGATACPGDNLYARLADIRDLDQGGDDDVGLDDAITGYNWARDNPSKEAPKDKDKHWTFGFRLRRQDERGVAEPVGGGGLPAHKHGLEGMTGPAV